MQEAGGELAIPTAFSGIRSLTLAITLCLLSISGVQPELQTCNRITLLSLDSEAWIQGLGNPEDAPWH